MTKPPDPKHDMVSPPEAVRQRPSVTIRPMRLDEAEQVARYHRKEIPTGVLAELGIKPLTRLYTAVANSEDGFVFVAVDKATDRVLGFVCGALSINRIYRSVLLRHFFRFTLYGLKHIFSWRMLRRIIELLLYPTRLESGLPEAEALSFVVDPATRGTGVATMLMETLATEFRQRGCPKFKLMVRADFERANAFYVKHGFQPAGQTDSHGFPSNIYTIETGLE